MTQADITDQRLNSEVCGIANPFNEIDTSSIFIQFTKWLEITKEKGEADVADLVAAMEGYLEMLEISGNNQLEEILNELRSWLDRMKGQLSEDAAGRLQVEIDELQEKLDEIEAPDFDDSGEVEGINSFTDFMSSFIKGTPIYQLFANLKAGLKYVLHAGQLVNNCVTDNPELPLSAAQGKFLMEQITGLNSDMGGVMLSYESGNFYAQYGGDESSKKVLGEIDKATLIEALSASGLGLTLQSTPEQIYAALKEKFPAQFVLSDTVMRVPFTIIKGSSNTDRMQCYFSSGFHYSTAYRYDSFQFIVLTTSSIDITSYKKVIFYVTGNKPILCGICKSFPSFTLGATSRDIPDYTLKSQISSGTLDLNIQNHTGDYYIGFSYTGEYQTGSGSVTKMELIS